MSHALPPAPPSIEISLSSRGVSKGLAQTDGPQAIARVEAPIGPFYAAGYVKNVTSTVADGEGGFSGGIRTQIAGWKFAASATWRIAIAPTPGSDNQSLELGASVSRKFGRLTPQLAAIWSTDDLGSTRRSLYVEASAIYALSPKIGIGGSVGRRDRTGGLNYTAFGAVVSYKVTPHVTAELRYAGTDKHNLGYVYQPGVIAAVRVRF